MLVKHLLLILNTLEEAWCLHRQLQGVAIYDAHHQNLTRFWLNELRDKLALEVDNATSSAVLIVAVTLQSTTNQANSPTCEFLHLYLKRENVVYDSHIYCMCHMVHVTYKNETKKKHGSHTHINI